MKTGLCSLMSILAVAVLFCAAPSFAAEYPAVEGVDSMDAVFDFRVGDPDTALAHLGLIHDMMTDPAMQVDDERPDIVIVFIGPSVRLISTDQTGFEEEQRSALDDLAQKIAEMDEAGFTFEICMTSAPAFDLDPDTILPEINKVENGWITIIGYQHQGYALAANF